jgi:hypothetical protein
MRIYIALKNIDIKDKLKNIEHLISSENYNFDMYSDTGYYRIENGDKISKINIIDGEHKIIENYLPNVCLIIDTSILKKSRHIPSNLPCKYIQFNYTVRYYCLRKKSPLFFVVELWDNGEIKDIYFMLYGNYAAYSGADIENYSIKEDFSEFLKMI